MTSIYDIDEYILLLADVHDLENLYSSSRYFSDIMDTENFWHRRVQVDNLLEILFDEFNLNVDEYINIYDKWYHNLQIASDMINDLDDIIKHNRSNNYIYYMTHIKRNNVPFDALFGLDMSVIDDDTNSYFLTIHRTSSGYEIKIAYVQSEIEWFKLDDYEKDDIINILGLLLYYGAGIKISHGTAQYYYLTKKLSNKYKLSIFLKINIPPYYVNLSYTPNG